MNDVELRTPHRVAAQTLAPAAVAAMLLLLSVAPAAADTACAARTHDGVAGKNWSERSGELKRRGSFHRYGTSVAWRLGPGGIELCRGAIADNANIRYRLKYVAPVWERHGRLIADAAARHAVPAELIATTIIEESGGKPTAEARYPGYVSDEATPHRVSLGLGQMLLSTAQRIAPGRRVTRATMIDPAQSIDLIAMFMSRFASITALDPPLVASHYAAGSLRMAPGAANRWQLVNGAYVDSYVAVFNATVKHIAAHPLRPRESIAALFWQGQAAER